MTPQTLLSMSGRAPDTAEIAKSVLIFLCFQNEFLDGPLWSPQAEKAVRNAASLLMAARHLQSRLIHVAHRGDPGQFLDRKTHRGQFMSDMTPWPWETVIEKVRPNGFSGTDLARRVGQPGTPLILTGFMTHNCVSSTARAALDLGYPVTVVDDACAARDLPARDGVISASDLHRAEIAGLADRHVTVASTADLLHSLRLHHVC